MSEKRGRPGRPRKDETVMKVLTKGTPAIVEEPHVLVQPVTGLSNLEYRPPETIVKKRKRGRPRKNIKFCPLVSNKGMVFEEEAEEEVQGGGLFIGKRIVKDPIDLEGEIEGESENESQNQPLRKGEIEIDRESDEESEYP